MSKVETKDVLQDRSILADIIRDYINAEIENSDYKSDKMRKARFRNLTEAYERLFAGKDMSFFSYGQVDELLKKSSDKDLLYVCRITIYAMENGFITDEKLIRLKAFKHRFTTQGATYTDFNYLMTSDIFESFVSRYDLADETAAKVFFFRTDTLQIKDENVRELTKRWIEYTKGAGDSLSSTSAVLFEVRKIAEKLFKNCSIPELKKESLICTKKYSILFRYLTYIDSHYALPPEVQYILTFENYIGGAGYAKFKELCLSKNVFQFIAVDFEGKGGRGIYHTDVPEGSVLFNDLSDFLVQSTFRSAAFTQFVDELYTSMGRYAVDDTSKLSYRSYMESNTYFHDKYQRKEFSGYLFSFYNFAYSKYEINFFADQGLDIAVLSKRGLLQLINKGFSIIKFNPNDTVPLEDQWLLCYQREYESSTKHPTSNTLTIDFSDVSNQTFKEWLKIYAWRERKDIKGKQTAVAILKEMLAYIHAIRTKEVLSLYCRDSVPLDSPITVNEAMAVRQYIKSMADLSPATQHTKIYTFHAFLHFLNDTGVCPIPSGAFYHLYTQNEVNNHAVAIPDDELRELARVMITSGQKSLQNMLYSVIFTIALDTEFRISAILSLEKDCIFETAKKGEYVLMSRKKDDSINDEQQPITAETKRLIDMVIEATADLRREAPAYLKNMLFIVPYNKTIPARAITTENFRKYMISCCEQAGIPTYTASNLRDTHMTKARAFKIKNQLSEIEVSTLTGHKSADVDMRHYVDMDITEMMEVLHGVIIGNVQLNGQIKKTLPENIATTENEVSSGCGYCQSPVCTNLTYLDCIMCKSFVTMPSRLPFFEEQVRQIDARLRLADTPHDKEDLVNIKRLLISYICEIKTVEEEM